MNEGMSHKKLMSKKFGQEYDFIVEDMLTVGVTLLSGKAKMGKSLFALSLANKVANGERFLNKETKKNTVLYISTEINEFQIQQRSKKMGLTETDDLIFVYKPIITINEIKELTEALIEEANLKVLILDTYQNIDFGRRIDSNSYTDVYGTFAMLKDMCAKYKIAIIVLHHNGKKDKNNPNDVVMGSTAFTGASDTAYNLYRISTFDEYCNLSITTNSFVGTELSLKFDKETLTFSLDEEEKVTDEIDRNLNAVIQAVINSGEKKIFGTSEKIASSLNLSINPIALGKLLKRSIPVLEQNHIKFSTKRSHERIITLEYIG